MIFETLILATALVVLLAARAGWRRSGDPFHPAVVVGALLFALYVLMPARLEWGDPWRLRDFLSEGHLERVQLIALVGVAALGRGMVRGGRVPPGDPPPAPDPARLYRAALLTGGLGVAGFAYTIGSVGGLRAAYGHDYGGGWSEFGYAREAFMLGLPAALLVLVARDGRGVRPRDLALVLLFVAPLVVHGLLGARRGPTFMALAGLGVGWCLLRGRRPSLALTLGAGAVLGFLMLFLVANRGGIYLGSEAPLDAGAALRIEAHPGNEFVYGAGAILHQEATGGAFWGRRWLVFLVVRPIPRLLWPTKYEDAAVWLGIPNLAVSNAGSGGKVFKETLGWPGAPGSATGLIADVWLECAWLTPLVLYGLGRLLGRLWARAVAFGGVPAALYALALSLSAYLVMQSVQAAGFRLILLGVPLLLARRHASPARAARALRPAG